jgi:two-component system, response regulator PdtaR
VTNRNPPQSILIVEHNELLKSLTVDIMEDAGFLAHQAGNADEALTVLESRSDIALVLTSISTPGSIDGLRLAHTVRNRWPGIKIIVASGQVRLTGYNLPTDSSFFFKPYHAAAMISEIRSLIGPRV